MPSLRVNRAADELAREIAARIGRWLLIGLGMILIAMGVAIAPLPGPLGVPLVVVGLMLVLRNSFKAKRQFVRIQHAHPKMVFPIRRLMRREPEIVQVFWQQYLRMERIVLPSRARFAVKSRRYVRRRFRGAGGG
jgi:predicted membrane chloride channel (bestrophin family)